MFINKQTNKQTMKNKIIATLVAFGLVGSDSAIEVNDNLSINGFIDGSYQKTDNSAAANTEILGLDEIEVNFLLNLSFSMPLLSDKSWNQSWKIQ